MNYGEDVRIEDRLAPDEPPYKSRGEAQIGRLLDRSGILFQYEQPTLVYDRGRHRVWLPDFSLPTFDRLIVEYAGMPDRPDYAAGIRRKQRVYQANEIPAVFIYPDDLRGRDWPDEVLEKIINAPSRVEFERGGSSRYIQPSQQFYG